MNERHERKKSTPQSIGNSITFQLIRFRHDANVQAGLNASPTVYMACNTWQYDCKFFSGYTIDVKSQLPVCVALAHE